MGCSHLDGCCTSKHNGAVMIDYTEIEMGATSRRVVSYSSIRMY